MRLPTPRWRTVHDRTHPVPPAGVSSLAAAGLMILGCCALPPSEAIEAEAEADPGLVRLDDEGLRLAEIVLAKAETLRLRGDLEVPGRITLNENATTMAGAVADGIAVDCCEPVGADVQEGQVLARLHSHEIHDAEAGYWEAKADLEEHISQLRLAKDTHQRTLKLLELKAGSLQQAQEAETRLRVAEAQVEAAEAGLQRADEHLSFLGLDPERLPEVGTDHTVGGQSAQEGLHLIEVRSPITGTIIERMISPGAVVAVLDPLYAISDLSTMWVIAEVPEQHLSLLRTGLEVGVSVRAYAEEVFPARITYIGHALDPETRTVEVRCDLRNHGRRIKAEMFATVRIPSSAAVEAVVVPATALQHIDGDEVVFAPEGEGRFRPRSVEVGQRVEEAVEILSGVVAGDDVVVGGAFRLKSELLKSRMIEE